MASKSILTQIREYFGLTTGEFTQEWRKFSDKDKQDMKQAFESESMTY